MAPNGATKIDFPVRPLNPSDLTIGVLLLDRPRRIRLGEPSPPNTSYDIALVRLSWDDGNGAHRSESTSETRNWDPADDKRAAELASRTSASTRVSKANIRR